MLKILQNVHDRWKLVLHLIESGKGTNEVVEEHRGKLNRSLLESKDFPTIPETVKVDGYYSLSDDDEDDPNDVEQAASALELVERLYDRC